MHTEAALATYRHDLGNGLVLRWSTAADTERLAQLVGNVFRRKADEPPNTHLGQLVHRLMRGDHPLMQIGDFGLIEDTQRVEHPIIACTCLWRQHWTYEGIPFLVGRPEIVASDPDYRQRGLIRALFTMIHARSAAEGHLVQAITGIPYFYRQFGYEYALDLNGGRTTFLSLIPKKTENTPEPFTLREATLEDIPLITTCYNRQRTGVIWSDIPNDYWQYELAYDQHSPAQEHDARIMVLVNTEGLAQGFVSFSAVRHSRTINVYAIGIAPEASWYEITPSLLRALQRNGEQLPTQLTTDPLSEITFQLGRVHPFYDALGTALAPRYDHPYCWYVRVPEVVSFIKHIAPVLERRIADSVISGYSGELRITFYRGGLRLRFEQGQLRHVESWQPPLYESNAQAGFPRLVFLKLLFCHSSLEELDAAFPDVWAKEEGSIMLSTLFPKKPSAPLPL